MIIFATAHWKSLDSGTKDSIYDYLAGVYQWYCDRNAMPYQWAINPEHDQCTQCAVPTLPHELAVGLYSDTHPIPVALALVCFDCVEDAYLDAHPSDQSHVVLDPFRIEESI